MLPNHLRQLSLILSSTGATPTFSRICSFLILSLRVKPLIHLSILISTTLNLVLCFFFKGQHSEP
ncbi:hypothetical protein MA16_Dca010471 [Dendrobium catenatum]|uniref:Uncharacterized protein n=1 Tax=Dendrobium catenatum TaxID=906689 RepID=A0A2I0XCV7_9ASPA|nr:hypothetical protein MA16_Dca010471 [Dendrobium catenatum]